MITAAVVREEQKEGYRGWLRQGEAAELALTCSTAVLRGINTSMTALRTREKFPGTRPWNERYGCNSEDCIVLPASWGDLVSRER